MILNLPSRLNAVNTLLESKIESSSFGFNDALIISLFFNDFNNTNQLIDEIDLLLENNIELLFVSMKSILHETNRFALLDIKFLYDVSFIQIFEEYIKPFHDRYSFKLKESRNLRIDYNEKNNRYDTASEYWDGVEKFNRTKKEFEIAENKYKAIQAEIKSLYNELKQEERKYCHIYGFKPKYLEVLVLRLREIAQTIINEINVIKGGE